MSIMRRARRLQACRDPPARRERRRLRRRRRGHGAPARPRRAAADGLRARQHQAPRHAAARTRAATATSSGPWPSRRASRRVVSLGDSFAWGASVEFEDAYPQRLERGLTRRRREPWEVVNLALPGMNTVDQAAQLADEGLAYGPDVVLRRLRPQRQRGQPGRRGAARRRLVAAEGGAGGLLDRSALVAHGPRRGCGPRPRTAAAIAGYKSMYADDAPGWIAAAAGAEDDGRALPRARRAVRGRDLPALRQPARRATTRSPRSTRRWREAAGEAGARVVDLLPAYRGLRWELLVVDGVDDEHPNEIAHRIAAGVILHALDDVVPWTPGPAARRRRRGRPAVRDAAGWASSWPRRSWSGLAAHPGRGPRRGRRAALPEGRAATSSTSRGTRTWRRGSIRIRRSGSGSRRAASGWPAPPACSFAVLVKLPVLLADLGIVVLLARWWRALGSTRACPARGLAVRPPPGQHPRDRVSRPVRFRACCSSSSCPCGSTNPAGSTPAPCPCPPPSRRSPFPVLLLPFLILSLGAARAVRFALLATVPVALILVPYAIADFGALGASSWATAAWPTSAGSAPGAACAGLATGALARSEAAHWPRSIAAAKVLFLAGLRGRAAGPRPRRRLRLALAEAALAVFLAFLVFYGAISAQYLLWPVPAGRAAGGRVRSRRTASPPPSRSSGSTCSWRPGVLTAGGPGPLGPPLAGRRVGLRRGARSWPRARPGSLTLRPARAWRGVRAPMGRPRCSWPRASRSYVTLAVTSMRTKSATFDEAAHLPAGYTYLQAAGPPAEPGAPAAGQGPGRGRRCCCMDVQLRPDDEAWRLRRQWEFGRRFLYRWNDADRLLFWGRRPHRGPRRPARRGRLLPGAPRAGACPPAAWPCSSARSARTSWPTARSSPPTWARRCSCSSPSSPSSA